MKLAIVYLILLQYGFSISIGHEWNSQLPTFIRNQKQNIIRNIQIENDNDRLRLERSSDNNQQSRQSHPDSLQTDSIQSPQGFFTYTRSVRGNGENIHNEDNNAFLSFAKSIGGSLLNHNQPIDTTVSSSKLISNNDKSDISRKYFPIKKEDIPNDIRQRFGSSNLYAPKHAVFVYDPSIIVFPVDVDFEQNSNTILPSKFSTETSTSKPITSSTPKIEGLPDSDEEIDSNSGKGDDKINIGAIKGILG